MKKKNRKKPNPAKKNRRDQKKPTDPSRPQEGHDEDPGLIRFYDELPYKVIRPKPQGGQNESSDG